MSFVRFENVDLAYAPGGALAVQGIHDATGLGSVVKDLLDNTNRTKDFIMAGRQRDDMLSDFIAAVKLQGASTPRIILGHVVPLCMSSLIVRVTLDMAGIILTAAGLGFLGLGAQPPLPEWGAMMAVARALSPASSACQARMLRALSRIASNRSPATARAAVA